jgi:4-hydroxybenzoate polyprenyltransferase
MQLIRKQDREDDVKAGVKGMAVWLGDGTSTFLACLGLLQVLLFGLTALKAHMSVIFWVFGLGVWAINIPWHLISLDLMDRKSGGRVFKRNIMLGLYMTGIALVDLFITRVYLHSISQMGERILMRL